MSDSQEKQLISAFSTAWNEAAAAIIGRPSALKLLALREVSGDGMAAALAVATTWSSAFASTCTGGMRGVLVCLFKTEEGDEIDRLAKQPGDGAPKPGGRAVVEVILKGTAQALASALPESINFGAPRYLDLAAEEGRLESIVGHAAHVGTFSLSVGDDIDSQALLLYAPFGSLDQADPAGNPAAGVAQKTSAAPGPQNPSSPPASRRQTAQRRDDVVPRNIERLLDVELEVVVRFGITSVPLRDVVRMGVGSMIELNRGVDEPVELLVNGRLLAKGEVVVVDGYYGVRITEIGALAERAGTLV